MSNEDEFFAEMHPQIAQVIGIAVMQLLVEKREPSREALIEMIQVLWQGDQVELAVELALDVLMLRDIPTLIPSGTASVFNFIEVKKVEAWSSPYGNPAVVVSGSAAYTNIVALDLTVGPTSAIMPRSTKADVSVGMGERAFASVKGNPSTWGARDSATVAVALDITRENAGDKFLPLTLKFHCNVW